MRGAQPESDADALGDRALVVALRCGSPAAVRAFVSRFRPMLVMAARRYAIDEAERGDLADELLAEAAAHFMDSSAPVPLSVRGYLLRGLRNRVLNAARGRQRRERATAAATDAAGDPESQFERAVPGCASEHSLRSSRGPDWDGPSPLTPALARLAGTLAAELSVDERLLVTWLGHHVPHQEIAAWLGLGYDATSKRIRRLRARLHAAALRYAADLDPTEREQVLTFLRRAADALVRGAGGSRS